MKRGAKKLLESIVLKHGGHSSVEDGLCAMEAVAYIAGEPHSDRPECASPVLAAYVRSLNDNMPEDQRQRLKPYILKLVKSANPALDQERANVLAWASITQFAPTALHAVGLVDHAETLRNLPKYDWKQAESAAYAAARAAYAADAAAYAARAANIKPTVDVWDLALAALDAALEVK